MSSPPPVPPKDHPCETTLSRGTVIDNARPANGSKRSREPADRDQHATVDDANREGEHDLNIEVVGDKRQYAVPTPNSKSLRRTRKVPSFTGLHSNTATAEQRSANVLRESKFQEGSLSDKPCEIPPGYFIGHDSVGLAIKQEKALDNYFDDIEDTKVTHQRSDTHHALNSSQRDSVISVASTRKDKVPNLFRLSRDFAASLHPVNLWNKLWNESRDELMSESMNDIGHKPSTKDYSATRHTNLSRPGNHGSIAFSDGENHDPGNERVDHINSYQKEGLQDSNKVESDDFGMIKPARGLRARLSFKRPSLTNLRDSVKRVRSDYNLAASYDRESSSSVSPVKNDMEQPILRKTVSRHDLRKQNKLSKRVSDLEYKLQQARRELNDALVEASPTPDLRGRHGDFMTQRSRFVPGALPTLPSESLLNVEAFGVDVPAKSSADVGDFDGDETIKAPRGRVFSPRIWSLFPSLESESFSSAVMEGVQAGAKTSSQMQVTQSDLNPEHGLASGDRVQVAATTIKSSKKRKSSDSNRSGILDLDDEKEDVEQMGETPRRKRKRRSLGSRASSNNNHLEAEKIKSSIEVGEQSTMSSSNDLNHMSEEHVQTSFIPPQLGLHASARSSMESQAHSLEPVYEEEEDVFMTTDRNGSTPKQTSDAEHHDSAMEPVKGAVEENMMTRAGKAAQHTRARASRARRQASQTYEWPEDVF